jgi:CheY-like chemotaxis protein
MNIAPPYNVLIIDDNPEFIRSLKSLILDVAGPYISDIQWANNGLDGLEKIRDNNFHLVFMDIDMPYIDGITATRFASFEYQKPDMKIIAVSFHSDRHNISQMLRAGASAYIIKDEIDADNILELFDIDIAKSSNN